MSCDDDILVQGSLWRDWKLVITQPDGGSGTESALLKLEERDGDKWNSIWVQLTVKELRELREAASRAVVRLTEKVEDLRAEERLLTVAQMAANIRGTAEAMRDCLNSTLRTPAEIVDIMKAVLESTAENMRALANELERKEESR